jgi:hypothetical protein
MRKVAAIMAIAVVCLAAVAVAAPETKSVVGTITRIDNASKSMVVKDASGPKPPSTGTTAEGDGASCGKGSMVKVETRIRTGRPSRLHPGADAEAVLIRPRHAFREGRNDSPALSIQRADVHGRGNQRRCVKA